MVLLDPERALVQTVDFFTPIHDDPYTWGVIAAANALSDVYAMGGEPLCAMNLVAFPDKVLPVEVLREVLRGGLDKLKEAGAMLVGGHSIRDDEPKYGMSVSGLVHPERIWRNGGALPGDALVLTKGLGTGVLATAYKREVIDDAAYAPAVASMSALNRDAMLAAREGTVHACTDVTGFGLAGHALEMAKASNATIRLFVDALPVLPGARDAILGGHVPGGAKNNRSYLGDRLRLIDLDVVDETLVVDPQTSGGLLVAVPADEAAALVARLHARGVVVAAIVGEVLAGEVSVEAIRRA